MTDSARRSLAGLFDEVAVLYDRVRPAYPDQLFADLVSVTGIGAGSALLEVGCGTGQATRALARLGRVTAVEPGARLAALARERAAAAEYGPGVEIEVARFEQWAGQGRRFDALVAASSWHWIDPSVGWRRAHDLLRPGGWIALLGNVVVRRAGEAEVYAETADLHERFSPGDPDWGDPPTEDEVRRTSQGWGPVADPGELFAAPLVFWYPTVQWFDGAGFADLMRTTSIYRKLEPDVREGLLGAVADRIRTRLGDRVPRRYLSVLRVGRRVDLR